MKPEKGFTRLPNAVYGVLSDAETVLYGYLRHRQGSNQSSYWSIPSIAHSLNWSESKVRRVTKTLEVKGWLKTWITPHPQTGKSQKHYHNLMGTPVTSEPHPCQSEPFTPVASEHLKRTKKNNHQQEQVSASAHALDLVDDDLLILDKPNLDKPRDRSKGALEGLNKEKPFPDLLDLISALPKGVQAQVSVTSKLNDLLAQLMLTQNRSMGELKLWLGEPNLWKEARNGGAFLTSLLKKQLENGYTLKEGSPLVRWSGKNLPPYCGECDPETRKASEFKEIPNENGAKTQYCFSCSPFMLNRLAGAR